MQIGVSWNISFMRKWCFHHTVAVSLVELVSFVCLQLALYVLSFLEPRDLLRAAQTCRNWRFLAEDNLLWREKCREAGIDEVRETIHRRRQRTPSVTSPWKVCALCTAYPRVTHVAELCSY